MRSRRSQRGRATGMRRSGARRTAQSLIWSKPSPTAKTIARDCMEFNCKIEIGSLLDLNKSGFWSAP